mgnify:CR=1 FL=1
MNRECLLGVISVFLLIVFYILRSLWRLHVANELEPTVEDIINGYFTLYENRVDTISVNHVITVRNGILLHCPVQDDTEYIISD